MTVDRLLKFQFRPMLSLNPSATGLAIVLGLGSGFWMAEAAIVPPRVQAYETRVDVGLDRLPNESYQTLVQRAEQVARAAAQRSFDRDILISQVSVIVIGRNQGAEAPILTLDVSRVEWRNRPDPRRWATYYRTAPSLLGFDNLAPTVFSPPVQSPPVQTVPPVPVAPTRTPAVAPSTPQSPRPPAVTPPARQVAPPPARTQDNDEIDPDDQEP